jgi:RNA polymerase sigma factor (sigma-70 family)
MSTPPDTPAESDALEDELLAIRCQLGEPGAFDLLIERWHGPLWKYARRLTGEDDAAAETVQDVWLRILRGISRLREPSRLRAWIFGIARRALMDRLRVKLSAPVHVDVDVADLPGTEDADDLSEAIGRMHQELARLPVTEREVLVLFYLQELSLAELAEVLAIPVGTVKSRLFRARQLLRRQLEIKGVQR